MNLTDTDPFMGFLVLLAGIAFVVASWNVFQIIRVEFYRWRTRRFIADCRRQDDRAKARRRKHAYGDTLLDEIRQEWGA